MSIIHKIDHVTFQLKEKHNFEWLSCLGSVFSVFDQQDSGNISFGIEKEGKKYFVKYAGAKTINYNGETRDAVFLLKNAAFIYEDLRHPNLVQLIEHFEIKEGYVLIFEWFPGECLHPHWAFPPPEKYTHPNSPYFRFRRLSIEQRLASIEAIFEFHLNVLKSNYVSIDFYDGSILYDSKNNRTKICDIDLYQKKPVKNTMGRMWGSSRFMSPEEFELGADIDEVTNVFNMGAIAFGLLGGEIDRSFQQWDAGGDLYEVAKRAVDYERSHRYPSFEDFYMAWKEALQK